ncbi:MAG: hypothetical protein II844_00525 [Prevotella sp.]|nr:hypothetical protein [Prevotella sp.]
MKKISNNIFMLLVMMLLSVSTVTAKSIDLDDTKAVMNAVIGDWDIDLKYLMEGSLPEGMESADCTLSFRKGDAVSLLAVVSGQVEGIGLKLKVAANGKWTLKGKVINVGEMDSKIELTDIKLPEEYKAQLKAMGMTEDSLKKMFESKMSEQNPLDDNDMIGDLTIVSIDDDSLTLTDEEGKTVTLKRKK